MYDPITAALIRSGPALPGLDRDTLPEHLTRLYAQLVSARLSLRLREIEGLEGQLVELNKLASAYETYAAVLPERDDRDAAGFIAATAHGILALAAQVDGTRLKTQLQPGYISADVSACLLFLASGHAADATEVARKFEHPADLTREVTLLKALAAMVQGDLTSAHEYASAPVDGRIEGDLVLSASNKLYGDIAVGLDHLITALRDGSERSTEAAQQTFQQAQRQSVHTITAGGGDLPLVLSSFAGPHHLSTLLLLVSGTLPKRAMSAVPTPPGLKEESWLKYRKTVAARRPFLWKSHEQAVASGYLAPGTSAVFSFPTGAGKSTMAELKVATALANDTSIIYLVPTHALVAQVVRDLRRAFPGIAVEDSLVRDGAYSEVYDSFGAIAVMTPERALTMLNADPDDFAGVGLIILDECHLMHPSKSDHGRRSLDAMLCLLTALEASPTADVLLMSAMMANASELAEWIARVTGRPCVPLSINWKPTRQVRGCVVFDLARMTELNSILRAAKQAGSTKAPGKATKAQLTAAPHALFGLHQTWASMNTSDYVQLPLLEDPVLLGASQTWHLTPNRNQIAARIASAFAKRGMKTLVFAEGPESSRTLAHAISSTVVTPPDLTLEEERLKKLAIEDAGGEVHLLGMTDGGALFHNGLLLPFERRLVEEVFRRDHEEPLVLVGTPTLAQGINLPAEVVILAGDDRFDEAADKKLALEAQELLNAVGRAGRAGFASVGIVLVVPGQIVSSDTEHLKLGEHWFQLQRNVFSKVDQCVSISDPVEVMLDIIQTQGLATREARYFINRLPADDEQLRRLMSRSFGAYRAAVALATEQFEAKVGATVVARGPATAPTIEWAMRLATSCGISLELASDVAAEVTTNSVAWRERDVAQLVSRCFDWLAAQPKRAEELLRMDEVRRVLSSGEDQTVSVLVDRLKAVTLAWLTGATLLAIQKHLDGDEKIDKGCVKARKVALRLVPDVAYALGVFTRAYRLSVGDEGEMPLGLSVAVECLKRGLESPELLALVYEFGEDSRFGYRARMKLLSSITGDDEGEFDEVRARVLLALRDAGMI